MLTEQPRDEKSLDVAPQPIEIVLSEDGIAPVSLFLPPYKDMAEVSVLTDKNFSVKEWALSLEAPLRESMVLERVRLERKISQFGTSQTFWHRLANAAALAGEFETEATYLAAAANIRKDDFVCNRIGENLIARHLVVNAKQHFANLDLSRNLHANLRLASFHMQRREFDEAAVCIKNGLQIDPIDFGARLLDGALKYVTGRFEEAIFSYKIAAQERQNSVALHTNMAWAYVRLGRIRKAFQHLRKAVAIDPLNSNAITLLSDLSFETGASEDAIPSLRYFVRFEQKSAAAWARLARALLEIGEHNEAIAALKRQGSVEDSCEVWNNLGAAYHRRGDESQALKSFSHAMTLSDNLRSEEYLIAARNVANAMIKNVSEELVLRFVDSVVAPSNQQLFAVSKNASGIFTAKMTALVKLQRNAEAVRFGEELLASTDLHEQTKAWIASVLMSLYAINFSDSVRSMQLAREYSAKLQQLGEYDDWSSSQLNNNIAFVYAEYGDLEDAARHLQNISHLIHKEPYPTATLGLLHLKRGHLERANELYSDALRLCLNPRDKARIRQKWNLEMGKALLPSEARKAARFFIKAKDEKDGEPALGVQASKLLRPMHLLS